MIVGYARTSTVEQRAGYEAQKRDLEAAGAKRIFSEQVSSIAERIQLEAALDFVREGDTLLITKLDRLARSTIGFLKLMDRLEKNGVGLRILDFGGSQVDTQSPSGRLMLTMFAAMGEWERSLMLERQREGIAKAKLEGKYKGRKPTARARSSEVCQLKSEGMSATKIAERLSIGRASVYRILADNQI
ncbi:recombinase family protein [Tepidamorphus sp. 3E244]|uniref:recombinase family protein n=1 Tax=Tepidamorphus sp. 3E244 TaxID=3385498 RepID=UPI0038FCEF23